LLGIPGAGAVADEVGFESRELLVEKMMVGLATEALGG
jgi:hypothetical protein